jgi:hypothetical protein
LERWASWLDACDVAHSGVREIVAGDTGTTTAEPLGAMLDFVDPDGIQLDFLFLDSEKIQQRGPTPIWISVGASLYGFTLTGAANTFRAVNRTRAINPPAGQWRAGLGAPPAVPADVNPGSSADRSNLIHLMNHRRDVYMLTAATRKLLGECIRSRRVHGGVEFCVGRFQQCG